LQNCIVTFRDLRGQVGDERRIDQVAHFHLGQLRGSASSHRHRSVQSSPAIPFPPPVFQRGNVSTPMFGTVSCAPEARFVGPGRVLMPDGHAPDLLKTKRPQIKPILSFSEADLKHACLGSTSDSVSKNVPLESTGEANMTAGICALEHAIVLTLGSGGTGTGHDAPICAVRQGEHDVYQCSARCMRGGRHMMTKVAGTAASAHTAWPSME